MIETRELPIVAEPTTPIKPSEALRLGRLLRPRKCTGSIFRGNDAACAVGAIHVGMGGRSTEIDFNDNGYWRLYQILGGSPLLDVGMNIFDAAEHRGEDGDAAVLAYLEERGL